MVIRQYNIGAAHLEDKSSGVFENSLHLSQCFIVRKLYLPPVSCFLAGKFDLINWFSHFWIEGTVDYRTRGRAITLSYEFVLARIMDKMGWLSSTWKGTVLILAATSCAWIFSSNHYSKYSWQPSKATLPKSNNLSSVKRILFFNPMFGLKDWGFGIGSDPFKRCSVENCFATSEGNAEDFDAVLFHARNFEKVWSDNFEYHYAKDHINGVPRPRTRTKEGMIRFNGFFLMVRCPPNTNAVSYPFFQVYVFVTKESSINERIEKWTRFQTCLDLLNPLECVPFFSG